VRFEVLMAVNMLMLIFWVVMPWTDTTVFVECPVFIFKAEALNSNSDKTR
jgi:diacylglycerol kinase